MNNFGNIIQIFQRQMLFKEIFVAILITTNKIEQNNYCAGSNYDEITKTLFSFTFLCFDSFGTTLTRFPSFPANQNLYVFIFIVLRCIYIDKQINEHDNVIRKQI